MVRVFRICRLAVTSRPLGLRHLAPAVYLPLLIMSVNLAAPSYAVQIGFADGSGNREAPLDDPGFANVGTRGRSSAVYIGDGWVLTAAHVSGGNVKLGGTTYQWLRETNTVIRNPAGTGLSEFADLRLFRLATEPSLPDLTLSRESPEAGTFSILIGNGKDRDKDLVGWSIEGNGSNRVWRESAPPADENGFKWLTTNSMGWGANEVDSDGNADDDNFITTETGFADTISLSTTFDDIPNFPEGQAATNDSGGALFTRKANGDWELTGIIHSIGLLDAQPSQTSVFGNRTFAAAIPAYYDAIIDTILHYRTDTNHDDVIDAFDASQVIAEWGGKGDVADFNRDGFVDSADAGILASYWSDSLGSRTISDLNRDGRVDAHDAARLAEAWAMSDPLIDIVRDGIIDAADMGALAAAWTGDSITSISEIIAPIDSFSRDTVGIHDGPRAPRDAIPIVRLGSTSVLPEPQLDYGWLGLVAMAASSRVRRWSRKRRGIPKPISRRLD